MSSSRKVFVTNSDVLNLPYNYVPTEWVCIVFVALFGVSCTIHIVQAIRFRLWWLFPTAVLCGLLEVIGWSGRLWSSKNPFLQTPFLMQIATTIVAPTPLVAAIFIILGRITRRLGPQYCRLTPRQYTTVFLSFDIVALVVQSIGGGIASGTQPDLGGHIALGGIVLQLVVLLFYTALSAEFLIRFNLDRPSRHSGKKGADPRSTVDMPMAYMLIGMSAMTIFLLIRSIYRTIELSGGWNGKVISTQWLFNVFDGAMIVLAIFTLNFFHPGVFLRGKDGLEGLEADMKGEGEGDNDSQKNV
ncbi:RTA1-domain-containing protein [Multifurca ochricompacta]|uniref:RTA1-domain-containing protein n=1 Tax=Multifurca ochricompacta TaxID=376703 RepID=A0AAD4M781_9AGAM|nr:RTA1-domain-containing protein [Multifurca ochricompacta]